MAVPKCGDFHTWIQSKLDSLNLDREVYLEYITGVLEEEENEDEDLKQTLVEILSGVLEENVEEITDEILLRYKQSKAKDAQAEKEKISNAERADSKIKSIISKQQESAVASARTSASNKLVDNEMKKLVLNQYNNRAVSDASDESEDESKGEPSEFLNLNAEAVLRKEQEQREKSKKDSDEKKVRDKLNREKEKQKKEERQEKEKKRTQKGERKAR